MTMAFVDRLKPNYKNSDIKSLPPQINSKKQSYKSERSPTQNRAKAIVKKYKRQVRQTEFRRLQSIIPAVREDDQATEADILEETMKYINDLHLQLLERIQTTGLPHQLRNATGDSNSREKDGAMGMEEMKELLGKAIHPKLEESWRQRRAEEKVKIKHLVQANELGHQVKITFRGTRPQ